jgi:hypothetical protein
MSSKFDEDSPDEKDADYFEAAKKKNRKLVSIAKGTKKVSQKPPLPPRNSSSSKNKSTLPTASVMMLANVTTSNQASASSSSQDVLFSALRKRRSSSALSNDSEASDAVVEDVDSDNDSEQSGKSVSDNEEKHKNVEDATYRDAFLESIPTNSSSKPEVTKLMEDADDKTVNVNFYNLIVAAAGDTITRGDEVRTEVLHTKIHDEFFNILSIAPNKKSLWRDKLFVMLENNTWPESFTEYVSAIKKECNDDISKIGARFWRSFKAVKKAVNNSFNKRYINPEDLASGRNESGLFDTIRRCYWDEEEKPQKLAVRNRNKAYAEAKAQDTDNTATEQPEESKKSRPRSEKTYDFEPSWFPPMWLAFVMFGKPGKMRVLNSLSSGGTAVSTTQRVIDRLVTKREKTEEKYKTEKTEKLAMSSEKSRTFTHNYVISKAAQVETPQTVEDEIFDTNTKILDLYETMEKTTNQARLEILNQQLYLLNARKNRAVERLAELNNVPPASTSSAANTSVSTANANNTAADVDSSLDYERLISDA